ncbi:aspartyl protease family protein [Chryseolinea lacunae]|uniref:Aspartyl protease family protein n=1 Tax=Chryseolinea lacunae TaxID=2801331 RepID=A0ABS1KR17_9BACT|nr:aspartyl protease family protein [Chryseolinea lacunae]MBL0741692.1 aspartyl protease family protein [Chryseolinea lacunae]
MADGKKKVRIPIEIHNNLVVVPVVLNDALPLKFILDTGVRTTILTQKTFSDILNLTYSRKYSISGPGGEKLVDAYVTNNVSIELPGVHGRGHAMLVLAEDYLELRNYLGTDVHGILGYELFSRFIIEIDYDKKILTLMLPEKFHKRRKFQAIPIMIEDTKPYMIAPVTFEDGRTLNAKLLMDSGASHGLMLEPSSDSVIQVPEQTVSSLIGRGLGGEIFGKVGRIKTLSMGAYKLKDVICNFPDLNSYTDSIKVGNVFRNGAIGGEVLSRFTVVFNFPKERVYLKRNSAFNKNFYYNLSGLTLKAKGSQLNVFEVTEVRDQSASQKGGIVVGDIIITINGIPTHDLNLNLINGFFNSKPGKRIKVEITRKGERMKKEIRLQDQI